MQSTASAEATATAAPAAVEALAALTLGVPNLAPSGSFETECQENLEGSTRIPRKPLRI